MSSASALAGALRIHGSGVPAVNQDYDWQSANKMPPGFKKVCLQNQWDPDSTWQKLNAGNGWLRAPSNEAYIYYNQMDKHWWIDEPQGAGVFIAPSADTKQPPKKGWRALDSSYEPLPMIEQ